MRVLLFKNYMTPVLAMTDKLSPYDEQKMSEK
jgi:hypothetical protein